MMHTYDYDYEQLCIKNDILKKLNRVKKDTQLKCSTKKLET